ncbi:MAG: exodeoxyribonuclease VII large subunit [Bacteroidota bacterium]
MNQEQLTLGQLNKRIREVVLEGFPVSVWVVAEIMELSTNRSGHCYMELVEKGDNDAHITARARATIWAFQYRMLRPYFETTTGITLAPGLKILFKCTVEFHEQYGLSLNITDIDPNYTMGDLARRRQEIIRQLKAEGIFDMNRETELPPVPQRIAVISSESAAGYGDFMNTLLKNPYGFAFTTRLFPAIMQGIGAEASVISALEQIFDQQEQFDCVALIRGGGSQADLDCFNSYEMACHIAQFPLPVLTGIGHERDESIADLVAHTRLKTPTAVAEFLIDQLLESDSYLRQLEDHFSILVRQIIQDNQTRLRELSNETQHRAKGLLQGKMIGLDHLNVQVRKAIKNLSDRQEQKLTALQNRMSYAARNSLVSGTKTLDHTASRLKKALYHSLNNRKMQLQMFEKQAELVNPVNTLKRGYTLTLRNGKIITGLQEIKVGEDITTLFRDGNATSRIEKIEKKGNKNG